MSALHDVNTTNLADASRLGCRTMQSVFNADDNDVPFFGSQAWPEARLTFSWAHSEAHVPGRHLNALLNAEDAAGIALEEDAVDKHARAAFLSYGGPVPLPLNRHEVGGPLVHFLSHNVREGFHALYALVAFRQSAQARALAEASIAAIGDLWQPGAGWNGQRIEGEYGLKLFDSPGLAGLTRAIGPLVKLYRVTGHAPALALALALKDEALARCFTPSGEYDRAAFGDHTHSTTCVMSSLAQLADLTHDAALMQRVRAFYDNGLWQIRDALGWVIESSKPEADPDRGEVNNTGDIVETALILGRWGYTTYYHDAERILRGHLLPSQLRDVSFIRQPPNPEGKDGLRDVARRHVGAFGFPAPYGHKPPEAKSIGFNMDIVGGAVASLCEAYRAATYHDAAGHWVNLLFDHETPHIQVESPYTHPTLRVRVKRPGPLFVRLPPWADMGALKVDGAAPAAAPANGYLCIPEPPLRRWLSLSFPLPVEDITLAHRTRAIRARLWGDAVLAMDNFGADLTYFPPLP